MNISYNDIVPTRHQLLARIKEHEKAIVAYKKQLDALDAPILEQLARNSTWADKMADARKQLKMHHKKHDPKH